MSEADERQKVAQAVDEVRRGLSLPGTPSMHDVQWEMREDANGQPAVYVTIVLEDQPSGELYSWEKLRPIRDRFWDVFFEQEVGRTPYVKFRLQSELSTLDVEDDADGAEVASAGGT